MRRRDFCIGLGGAALAAAAPAFGARAEKFDLAAIERPRVLAAADRFLHELPLTVTAIPAPRSPGGLHDYYSEADYWWPDPADPAKPYVRRDGFSNPAKFAAHRQAMMRLSFQAPALAAAWKLTGDARYADRAEAHLDAWFAAPATRMNPDLRYSQAIVGKGGGRSIGIIDAVQLVEVARAAAVLKAGGRSPDLFDAVAGWFADFLDWLTTSEAGIAERKQRNNHGSSWALQVAAYADLTGNRASAKRALKRFKTAVKNQIAADGRQKLELKRTKPYAYSLFNLDLLAGAAQLLGKPAGPLWDYKKGESGSLADALAFMQPSIADKKSWPFPPDVENFSDFPVRQPSLLFGGLALSRPDAVALWKTLDPDPKAEEVLRNFPIRQPLLWVG